MNQKHPLPDFLAPGDDQADFVSWLFGESHRLYAWAALGYLPNVVMHCALLSTNAQQWPIAPLCQDELTALPALFHSLKAAKMGTIEVIYG